MIKKSFKGGIDTLLGESIKKNKVLEEKPKRGRPRTAHLKPKEIETRATFVLNAKLLDDIRVIAHWERLSIKKVFETALSSYLLARASELPKARESFIRIKEL